MALNREQFLQKRAVPQESVFIPDLNDSVIVQGMTARQRSQFERQFQTSAGIPNKTRQQQFRELLVAECCVDDNGAKLFSADDAEELANQPAGILEPIVNAAMKLCGMSGSDVEKMAKNSTETNDAG